MFHSEPNNANSENKAIQELITSEKTYQLGLETILSSFTYAGIKGPLSNQLTESLKRFVEISNELIKNLDLALEKDITAVITHIPHQIIKFPQINYLGKIFSIKCDITHKKTPLIKLGNRHSNTMKIK